MTVVTNLLNFAKTVLDLDTLINITQLIKNGGHEARLELK